MKELSIKDTREFRKGREFEQEYAGQVLVRGGSVIRCYDLNVDGRNKAPLIEGPYKNLIVPDLLTFENGKQEWRECKMKADSTWTHREHRADHGIDLTNYLHYLEVKKLSGFRVCLVIGEQSTGKILIQSLDRLGAPRVYEGHKYGHGGMAYWPRSSFAVWGFFNRSPDQLSMFARPRLELHYSPGHWS